MKKNSYVVYGVMLQKGRRVVIETLMKDYTKLTAILRWKKTHKHQKLLKCFRGN